MDNLQEAFDRGFLAVKTYVDRELLDLRKRLVELEGRKPEKGDKGDPGEQGPPGRDSTPILTREEISLKISEHVVGYFAEHPPVKGDPGERGEKGDPGEPAHVDMAEVIDAITPEVAKWLEDNKPKDGVDGMSVTTSDVVKDVLPIIEEIVVNVVSEIPKPKDGVGVAGAVIDRQGALILTLTDGTTKDLGVIVGRDGKDGGEGKPGTDGKNGRDGFSPEDFTVRSEDGGRKIIFGLKRGDDVIEREVLTDTVIDRGVWTEGVYQRGDGCSHGGSFWIAQTDTKAKPETNADWRLAVRRGRDGKAGRDGKDGGQGPAGPQGPMGPRGIPA
jgi:hypothetical protein